MIKFVFVLASAALAVLSIATIAVTANDTVVVAGNDVSRFAMDQALLILEREAKYRADGSTPAGLFVYQFEALSRNRLGYGKGLDAIAHDPAYDEDWRELWWVRASGPARVVEDGEEARRAMGLLAEKYPQYRASPPQGPVVAIEVAHFRWWPGTPDD